jgi:hypothetical protein
MASTIVQTTSIELTQVQHVNLELIFGASKADAFST